MSLGEWYDYNILSLPPHCVLLHVEEEIVTEYTNSADSRVRQILAWYDSYLDEFHNSSGKLRGKVLRWRVIDLEGENNGAA